VMGPEDAHDLPLGLGDAGDGCWHDGAGGWGWGVLTTNVGSAD
jgi:hypothetical protein